MNIPNNAINWTIALIAGPMKTVITNKSMVLSTLETPNYSTLFLFFCFLCPFLKFYVQNAGTWVFKTCPSFRFPDLQN